MATLRTGWIARLAALAAAGALCATCGSNAPSPEPNDVAMPTAAPVAATSVRDEVAAVAAALGGRAASDLQRLYERSNHLPAWIDERSAPIASARDSLALLARAASHGLNPADYGLEALSAWHATLAATTTADWTTASRFDVQLSASLIRFLHDLHSGRVDPQTLGIPLAAPADTHDMAALVHEARRDGTVASLDDRVTPRVTEYQRLRETLERYRAIAARAGQAPLPSETGAAPPSSDEVARLLDLVGDLQGPLPDEPEARDAALRAGLERFQRRHGLSADGVTGPATTRALRVPLDWRVRQIELALERLRWLPDLEDRRVIAVNIPMFRLFAWDRTTREAVPALSMRVIVGRALDARTPVFAATMNHLVFRPYWNVPSTILRNEILPALAGDANYLSAERLEIVQGAGDAGPVLPPTPDAIAQLESGRARLRQRPGPTNALGLVKFMFPNRHDVYLHSTPSQALFGRTRRDFSHGCIRVEDPAALAAWVLGPDADWTPARIADAMNGSNNQRVNLRDPVHVMIVYTTAAIDPADGSVNFAEDLYLLDPKLDRALRR